MSLIEMDRRVLEYLLEYGGRLPGLAIPARLFSGEVPEDIPDMKTLGLIDHDGDEIVITAAGRAALLGDERR